MKTSSHNKLKNITINLKSSIKIISGNGSINNPYQLGV